MYAIDGLLMSLILMAALLLAFQMAPSQADIQEDISQQKTEQEFSSLFDIALAEGDLKNSVLYWDDTSGEWGNANYNGHYTSPPPSHPLSSTISELEKRGYAYSISLEYLDSTGNTQQHTLVTQGTPTSDGVVQSRTVTINDGDTLTGPGSNPPVSSSSSYFAPDAFPESDTYNIIRIVIIYWTP
jgi:hypothetical protein